MNHWLMSTKSFQVTYQVKSNHLRNITNGINWGLDHQWLLGQAGGSNWFEEMRGDLSRGTQTWGIWKHQCENSDHKTSHSVS